jgi:serine O-acetyltransferase
MISSKIADWDRETCDKYWHPGKRLLATIRSFQCADASTSFFSIFTKKYCVLRHRFWSIVTGADIPLNAKLGGGLLLPHPNGIVIHPDVVIGPNCLIFQQVTLGANDRGVPIIGGHVDIGAGAKVIGKIKIGEHVRIGANSVVVHDVPDGATVVGIPAKIVRINTDS